MKNWFVLGLLASGCNEYLDGTFRVHWLSESGDSVEYPMPQMTALVGEDPMLDAFHGAANGMMGGWTVNTMDGNQALLPNGALFLQLGAYFDVTAERSIDLDYYTFGRRGVSFINTPTVVTMELDGLEPWASTDQLQMFSLDAATLFSHLEQKLMTPPDPAATSAALTFDWNTGVQGIPTTGDHMYLTQLVQRTSDGLTYSTVAKALRTTAIQGLNTSIPIVTASLDPVPATTSVSLEVDADDFAQLAAQVHPDATFERVVFSASPKPGGAAIPFALAKGLPDVLLVDTQATVAGTALVGNPYPETWPLIGVAKARFGVTYTAPLASSSATLYTTIEVDHLATNTRAYGPEIGPVQHPQINHQSAFRDKTAVGQTPLVTWDPPRLGEAAGGYQLTIWEIANNAGATKFAWTAQLMTNGRSVRIPPNVLMLGKQYAFEITAISAAHDIEQQPLQISAPNAFASVLTGSLVP